MTEKSEIPPNICPECYRPIDGEHGPGCKYPQISEWEKESRRALKQQLDEIEENLRKIQDNAEHTDKETASLPEGWNSLRSAVKGCLDKVGNFEIIAPSLTDNPELLQHLETIRQKGGELTEMYFSLLKQSSISHEKMAEILDNVSTLVEMINNFESRFGNK